jgi:hypothetical protein
MVLMPGFFARLLRLGEFLAFFYELFDPFRIAFMLRFHNDTLW